jgi:hypothetical protein
VRSPCSVVMYLSPALCTSSPYDGKDHCHGCCCKTVNVKSRPIRKESGIIAKRQKQKHTTGGIPRWSPTLVLVARFSAYVWQSGRDAQFSLTCGRMYHLVGMRRKCKFEIEGFGSFTRSVIMSKTRKSSETWERSVTLVPG